MKLEYAFGFPPITTGGCAGRKILAKVTNVQGEQFDLDPIISPPHENKSRPVVLEVGWSVEAKLYETTMTDSQNYIGQYNFIVTDDKTPFVPSPGGTFGLVNKKRI